MTLPPDKNYSIWVNKAIEDDLSAKSIVKHKDGHPSTVCFLSQPIAEKLLKAILVRHKREYPKIHDLLALETMVMEVELDIHDYHDEFALLSRYYIETRYPDYPEFTWQDAKEAYSAASKVRKFILSKLQ